jgi:AcrR family transcriptional regulator
LTSSEQSVPAPQPDSGPKQPDSPARPARAESVATQQRILDAAEELFIELGFAATSLRAIASRAGVNLAAAHYHFGSKEGLFGATVHRRIAAANEMRMRGLQKLEARATPASVEEIITLFFEPLGDEALRTSVPRLVARIYGEPESISKPLLEQEFGPLSQRFVAALAQALPGADLDEVRWRFHFVIGSMIQLLNFDRPTTMPDDARGAQDGISELIKFAVAGLRQASPADQGGDR